uniref:Lipase domain-containing protein n=1 Tax=Anopheles atroparvus TaxID=41427 RepID=A0AAG5DN71_ANOAO
MRSCGRSKTVSVVTIVLLVAAVQLLDGARVFGGGRLVSRIRERRLEKIRQRQLLPVEEDFYSDFAEFPDEELEADARAEPIATDGRGNGSTTSDSPNGNVDYTMDTEDMKEGERRPPPIPLPVLRPNTRRSVFEEKILFRFYHDGNLTKMTTLSNDDRLLNGTECSPDERFAVIVHGWRENCYEVPWVGDLRENLRTYRGGCVACVDYSAFSSGGYGGLVGRFRDIRDVLLHFLQQLRYEGVQFERLYMFGFSFGAQLALDVGNQIGSNELEAIDTCDMAGPGFDGDRMFKQGNFLAAAKNVQCIHTSIDKGTKFPNKCHQNWRMGMCGFRQAAAGPPPLGSHGLCPVFYNLAFKYQFLAQPKPLECASVGEQANYPRNYRMGYMEDRKSEVRGELFAHTSDVYPYTVFTNPYNFFEYF